MARFITPPKQGEPVLELYKKVVECAEAINAMRNMTGEIRGGISMNGKLGPDMVFRFTENTEVGNLGT